MEETTYGVGELSRLVSRAIARAFPEDVWVRGQIRDLSRPASGHVYFSLVDPQATDLPPVVLPVALFAGDKTAVNLALSRSGAVRMTDGVEVRIRGRLTHYPPRGSVQLQMTWIDTDFTLGRLATDRDRLLRALSAEGLLDRNASLAVPLVPLRVGLITSAGSAAHADFMHELGSRPFAWSIVLADSRVQGIDAAASLRRAVETLIDVDVIAVVRGGGAATDLAAFDDEALARAIARSPVPVFTGIGHETDTTVADAVAARSFKTPTACGAHVVALVEAFLGVVDELAIRLRTGAESVVAAQRHTIDTVGASLIRRIDRTLANQQGAVSFATQRLSASGRRNISWGRAAVDRVAQRIGPASRARLAREAGSIDGREARARAQDPVRLLDRGWSITRDAAGTVLRDPQEVAPGDGIISEVAGGRLFSTVDGTRSGRENA